MRRKSHPWFEPRSYCHFDRPLTATQAEQLVASPGSVAKHAFSPLIWRNQIVRVWKKHEPKPEGSPSEPQPVSGPRPSKKAQADILRARETAGEKTNRGRWESKTRPLAYASHADAAVYSYYHHVLRQAYEAALRRLAVGDSPLAYRYIPRELMDKGKSSFHFAAESFAAIDRLGACRAHCLDIKSFFDNIPHDLLAAQYRRVLDVDRLPEDHFRVLQSVMKSSRVPLASLRRHLGISNRAYERMRARKTPFDLGPEGIQRLTRAGLVETRRKKGVPQGLPLSGLLANIAMLEIDRLLTESATATGCIYRRYSDDILIFGSADAADALAAEARRLIEAHQFTVPPKKATSHTFGGPPGGPLTVDKPLVYLGLEFDGRHVRLKSATVTRLGKRAKRCVDCMARAAAREYRRQGGDATFRLNRRRIYNLFSPLPFRGTAKERERWRGDFTDYARSAQEAVTAAFGRQGVSRITKQLHPRMKRLTAYIERREREIADRFRH